MTIYQSTAYRVRLLFSTLASITASNPVLLQGEVWREKDATTGRATGRSKTGDGAVASNGTTITGTAFNDLPFDPQGAALSDDAPQALGTAAAGTSTAGSRSDHRHALPTAFQVGADATGTAAAAVAAHVAAADPHPVYTTAAEAAAAAPVQSVSLSAPSGWSASSTNVGGSVTLTLALPTGYSLPSNASQADWDTAYSERAWWDGGSSGLNAATGRASLGLGSAAQAAAADFATAAQGALAATAVQPATLSGYQPLDSDLSAIAALSTTSYGRAFLALADAAAGRTALGLGSLATQSGTFSGTSSGTNTGDQSPGGSSGQIQYNNAGAFGGLSTLTADGSGNITLSARFINSYTSLASASAQLFSGTWFTGGTSTTTKPHFLIEPAGTTSTSWSTAGTGLGVNAASGFTGNLLDLQISGTRALAVSWASFGGATQLTYPAGSGLILNPGGTYACKISYESSVPRVSLSSSCIFGWQDGAGYANSIDLALVRDSANTLAQRNGTSGQVSRAYRTYTNASNYERVALDLSSDTFTYGPQAAGTGTLRPLYLSTGSTTVANLASAATVGAGSRAFVTDATATTFLSTVAGGGSNKVPVVSDGTNWLIG
jgi:hypothetical protein